MQYSVKKTATDNLPPTDFCPVVICLFPLHEMTSIRYISYYMQICKMNGYFGTGFQEKHETDFLLVILVLCLF